MNQHPTDAKASQSGALAATPVAPVAGDVDDTTGGVVSSTAVVNDQTRLAAIALPALSFAADVTVAV